MIAVEGLRGEYGEDVCGLGMVRFTLNVAVWIGCAMDRLVVRGRVNARKFRNYMTIPFAILSRKSVLPSCS